MIEKHQTNEKCPKCDKGILMRQYWTDDKDRVRCSNPDCTYLDYLNKPGIIQDKYEDPWG
jgi:ribosomal protein S27AE